MSKFYEFFNYLIDINDIATVRAGITRDRFIQRCLIITSKTRVDDIILKISPFHVRTLCLSKAEIDEVDRIARIYKDNRIDEDKVKYENYNTIVNNRITQEIDKLKQYLLSL